LTECDARDFAHTEAREIEVILGYFEISRASVWAKNPHPWAEFWRQPNAKKGVL
ncbi:MAG: hypothetical protein FD128_322, partial [Hyphomonadaceae bacterium]